MKTSLLVASLAAGLATRARSADPTGEPVPAPRQVRILALGNSFTANATSFLKEIVAGAPAGNTIRVETVWLPGASLAWLWTAVEIFDAEQGAGVTKHVCPQDRPCAAVGHGRPGDKGLSQWLADEPWDYVTLQQYSRDSTKPETYRPYAQQLRDYIKKHAPNVEVVMHETWAYRADATYFKNGNSAQRMYRELRLAYDTIAKELGCRLIPVGDAFWTAYHHTPDWPAAFPDPQFDYRAGFVHPALPHQRYSLQPGYSWVQDKNRTWKLGGDLTHAGVAGQYLAGCVWYEFFFKRSVIGNRFVPTGLSAEDAAILQKIAHRVVSEGYRPPLPE